MRCVLVNNAEFFMMGCRCGDDGVREVSGLSPGFDANRVLYMVPHRILKFDLFVLCQYPQYRLLHPIPSTVNHISLMYLAYLGYNVIGSPSLHRGAARGRI